MKTKGILLVLVFSVLLVSIVNVEATAVYFDDFESYEYVNVDHVPLTYEERRMGQIGQLTNGTYAGRWTSGDTYEGDAIQSWQVWWYSPEIENNPHLSRYVQFAQDYQGAPQENSNWLTFHATDSKKIKKALLSFDYLIQTNSNLKVKISEDNENWVDITDELNMIKQAQNNITENALIFLDKPQFSKKSHDLYIRFEEFGTSSVWWNSKIDDFYLVTNPRKD